MSRVSKQRAEELRRLTEQSDESIDTSDIPEMQDRDEAERGRFFRPRKQQVTLRIDADVLAWFKSKGDKYQTRINAALREYVKHHQ